MFQGCRRSVALSLIFAIVGFVVHLPLSAESQARLTGHVVHPDGVTPRAGVIVALVETISQQTYRSQPTNDQGVFQLDSAPAGTYSLVAEAAEGAYVASASVPLAPGTNRPVKLTLDTETAPSYQAGAGAGGGGGAGLAPWASWLIVGGIVVGAALVIDEVTEDDEEIATPF